MIFVWPIANAQMKTVSLLDAIKNSFGTFLNINLFNPLLRGSQTSGHFGEGTLLNQFCGLRNVIWLGFGQVESRLSQTQTENS